MKLLRSTIVLLGCGPVALGVPGCTSDLPAPTNFIVEEPPRLEDLAVDCAEIPVAAVDATYAYTPTVTGQLDGARYSYSATDLPAGITMDAGSGEIGGVPEVDPGDYTFTVTVEEDAGEDEILTATAMCTLTVNPRLAAPLDLDVSPYCLRGGEDLRSLVVAGTGDGTPITCDYQGSTGDGRIPNGITVNRDNCTLEGTIDEERYGTWIFIMRGTQSGASVHVPYCVTNDVDQGYDISGRHTADTEDELSPIMRVYDPTATTMVGEIDDPHYEITSPGVCGASCFFKYSFFRTNAPIDGNSFTLEPDGLFADAMGNTLGFFHEFRVTVPPVPDEFLIRPWVMSMALSYCLTGTDGGCADAAADGDAAFEFGLVMVPDRG